MPSRVLIAVIGMFLSSAAGRAADEDNPYKKSKVGDFSTYKLETTVAGMTLPGTLTRTVTAKSDKEVTVKATGKISLMGQEVDIPPTEEKIDLTKPYDPTKVGGAGALPAGVEAKAEKVKDGKEKIKVAGKDYDCTWVTYKTTAKAQGIEIAGEVKVWMSKEIPMGMAKLELTAKISGQDMKMTMELSETGNKKQ